MTYWPTPLFKKLIVVFALLVALPSLLTFAAPERQPAMVPVDRGQEPVIVSGVFPGISVNDIFVYREVGGSWEQIPFQIDEVSSAGEYVTSENLTMDANDEVIFMIKDLGDKATTSITEALDIAPFWYEIEVADPLNPSAKSWAYIVRSSTLNITNATDYVNFNAGTQRIVAQNYSLGWSTEYSGLNFLSLFGSANIIDRSKIRVNYHVINPQTLTEEDFAVPENILIKDGRVRVIIQRGTASVLAYASYQTTSTPIDLTGLPNFVVIDAARLSLDLTNNVPGATFYNENKPGGAAIDGNPDVVPATPVTKPWLQISTNSGTFIQVTSASDTGGTLNYYYKDNDTNDPNDTGDGKSYGDSGLSIANPTTRYFVIESYQYYLSGNQANRGNEFYQESTNPVRISLLPLAPNTIYLPVITSGN